MENEIAFKTEEIPKISPMPSNMQNTPTKQTNLPPFMFAHWMNMSSEEYVQRLGKISVRNKIKRKDYTN